MMNKAQVDIAYGFISIARSDPEYYAFYLMNNALGQYALGGRLGASIREWRGEATALAVYYLGEVEARQGHWAEAIAHYQRVFVAYQKYLPWAAKAYLRSAECFEKMGKRTEAVGHLKEMLRNERLRDFAETKQATRMLADWRAAG